ncbi:MAG: hypothetical protein HFI34_07330 [Lachnospiraceae bacterium]|nr:hypothetical protein [Lachnospiraceae bacterium]
MSSNIRFLQKSNVLEVVLEMVMPWDTDIDCDVEFALGPSYLRLVLRYLRVAM